MRIVLLCEARTGSTNLANWFLLNKNFTVLFEPISNPNTKWYKNNTSVEEWKYTTKYLLVKEVFNNKNDLEPLITNADKIVCLYRENTKEQIESFINADRTGNWHTEWIYYTNDIVEDDKISEEFKNTKKEYKKKYLSKDYFKISYEELYYNNGFQKILDYLNIPELVNKNFPYGRKYRVDAIKTKKFI